MPKSAVAIAAPICRNRIVSSSANIGIACRVPAAAAPRLASIDSITSQNPWSDNLFAREFEHQFSQLYGVRVAGEFVAFIVCHLLFDELHILNLGVLPEYRRRGYASKLIAQAIERAREDGVERVSLEVRRSNQAARRLYEQLGFQEIALRSAYYSDNGEDALVLQLDARDFMSHESGA